MVIMMMEFKINVKPVMKDVKLVKMVSVVMTVLKDIIKKVINATFVLFIFLNAIMMKKKMKY